MTLVVCGVLPTIVLALLFVMAFRDDAVAYDFRVFYEAAGAIVDGKSPYVDPGDTAANVARAYVYPPVTALGLTPLTLLPVEAAGLLVMGLLTISALAVPYLVGVRDWRCYGIMLLWPPVLSAIQTGNMTLLLGLGAALAWRFRDRGSRGAVAVGAALAVKLFLWPLVVWLVATRRLASALAACAVASALLALSWLVIGLDGLREYPSLLRRLEDTVGPDSYTVFVVGLDLGLPSQVARAVWLTLGLGLLTSVVLVARRGDERSAFILAIGTALALSPLVWLHYFALLLVVVALAQPTLSVVWFVPLAMVVTPGSGHPTPIETSATLLAAAATFVLVLRGSLEAAVSAPGDVRPVPANAR